MKKYITVLLFFVVVVNRVQLKAQNIDVSILKSIYKNETTFKNHFFKADAQSVIVFNIATPVSIFAAGLAKHDKELQKDAMYIAGAFVLSSVITQGLKPIVQRERPFVAYPNIFTDRYDGGGYSFPSGHTSAAFCTATSLSFYFSKWYVIAPSYLWAASVGWARMYQGVHYPSDVLAGAIVGAGSAWLGHFIQHKMEYRNKKK